MRHARRRQMMRQVMRMVFGRRRETGRIAARTQQIQLFFVAVQHDVDVVLAVAMVTLIVQSMQLLVVVVVEVVVVVIHHVTRSG